jgi:hypothetical protein
MRKPGGEPAGPDIIDSTKKLAGMKYRLVLRQTYVGCAYWEANWRRRTPRILRRYTLFIYAKPGSINYTSSCTLIVSGRRAWIDTLNGRDFYPLLAEIGLAPFAKLGIKSVEVDVKESHLRRIVRSLGHLIDVRRLRSIQLMDIRLSRIEIRARQETQLLMA